MARARSPLDRIKSLEDALPHDSFIVAVQTDAQTIGKTWERLTGFEVGPQNFDSTKGPDLRLREDLDGLDVVRGGRLAMSVNCQLSNPTGDGWFEPAVEPNGLDLSSELWPGDIAQGHVGVYVPEAIFAWDDCEPGAQAGYTAPQLLAGAVIAAWARFASASGTETIDVRAVLYATRITA